MELQPYVDTIQRQLEAAAEAGGGDAIGLAKRLVGPLDAAIRLALQDAVAAAAEEITCELAPGSVDLRLRGRDLEFVVTPPPADPFVNDLTAKPADETPDGWHMTERAGALPAPDGDESGMTRINLRLAEHLKYRVEQAASGEGLSVNAWLVRAAAAALQTTGPTRSQHPPAAHGSQRYTGWAR